MIDAWICGLGSQNLPSARIMRASPRGHMPAGKRRAGARTFLRSTQSLTRPLGSLCRPGEAGAAQDKADKTRPKWG